MLPNPSYLKPTVNYKYQSLQYLIPVPAGGTHPLYFQIPLAAPTAVVHFGQVQQRVVLCRWVGIKKDISEDTQAAEGLFSPGISLLILRHQSSLPRPQSHNILEAGPLAHLVVAAPVPLEVDEDSQKTNFQVALCIGSQ